jgi:hypothetical protein
MQNCMCFVRVCVTLVSNSMHYCVGVSNQFPTSKERQWFFLAERKSVSESYFVTNVLYMKNPCFHLLPCFLTAAPPRPDRASLCGYVPLTAPGVFAAILSHPPPTMIAPPEGTFRSTRAQARQYRLPYLSTRRQNETYKRQVLPRCVSSEPLVV